MRAASSLFLGILTLSLPALVSSCSCIPGSYTFRNSFENESLTAVKVYVRNEIFPNGPLDEVGNGFRYYRAIVLRTYRGCDLPRWERILISTGGNSALCGVELSTRTRYLLFGFLQDETVGGEFHRVLSVGSCQYQTRMRDLQIYQRRYLYRQPYQDICSNNNNNNGSCDCGLLPPGQSISCPDGSTAGFTGNCLDVGNGRCEWEFTSCPMCSSDYDCNGDTFCSAGQCRSIGTCGNVFDCYNPSNAYGAEILCILERECINEICGAQCCQNVFNCLQDPCQSLGFDYHSCTSDYCGGCHAFAYDQTGQRIR